MVLLSQHARAICTTQLHAFLIRAGLTLFLFADDGWRRWEHVFSLNLPHTPCASMYPRTTFMNRIAWIRSWRPHQAFSFRAASIQFSYLFASVWPCKGQWMHNVMRQTLGAIVLPCDHFGNLICRISFPWNQLMQLSFADLLMLSSVQWTYQPDVQPDISEAACIVMQVFLGHGDARQCIGCRFLFRTVCTHRHAFDVHSYAMKLNQFSKIIWQAGAAIVYFRRSAGQTVTTPM